MMWHARRENWSKQAEDARDDGDIDYARVIHSESFRRLQGKTQILNLGDSDFYRTRLTHSLEVAQIAGGVSGQLAKTFPQSEVRPFLPGRAMVQALGCMHDLGHPPFGHGGEVALNYCMRDHGGFEGNGQTLRILSRLEDFSENAGANLCRRSLLGVLKYPVPYARAYNREIVPSLLTGTTRIQVLDSASCKPPKCYMDSEQDVVEWLLEDLPEDERAEFCASEARPGKHARSRHKSLDCSIMDVADDIAYGVHDLEDAIALQLIDRDTFATALRDKCPTFLDAMKAKYPAESENDVFEIVVEGLFGEGGARKRFIGRLVHHFITAVEYTELPQFTDPLLRFRARLKAPQRAMLDVLQDLVVRRVIRSPTVQQLEFKGQGMVVAVFEALMAEPERLLSPDALTSFAASGDDPRIICDHIAAMTDTHLLRIYDRLFSPRMGSIFDRI
ncbi:anti-phage deoxyguanosine triphosphatase [Altericroceibacterium endophyticum]|uniref:DNTP triphosphohydrolase n=1 Tax=Altericroceibacterium endophyticum TaxID=1808508 RepID=A0A6I4T7N1_9SPHN|nr:anti-phage deoxyguanosine triphosphatase [Altericroceibacterium endophyticum]MXO67174.1 dNTP triphosphohydrolase [Altericroceibacterium endophyticum]